MSSSRNTKAFAYACIALTLVLLAFLFLPLPASAQESVDIAPEQEVASSTKDNVKIGLTTARHKACGPLRIGYVQPVGSTSNEVLAFCWAAITNKTTAAKEVWIFFPSTRNVYVIDATVFGSAVEQYLDEVLPSDAQGIDPPVEPVDNSPVI